MSNKEKNIPKRRFKEFENADAWELHPLREIGNTYTGLSGKTKDDFGHGDGRFVTYMNVFSNPISLPEMVEEVEFDESQNTVRYGDVLFTTSSETPEEVGMSSVWLENTENTYLNSFCFGFRPVKKVNPYYLAYLLRSSGMRRKISFLAQGISRYNISKTKMMELEISIPNENEQSAIGTFFSTLDQHITLHQRKLDKLKNVKQAYLSEMFPAEGERVPKRRFPGFTDAWEQRKLGEVGEIERESVNPKLSPNNIFEEYSMPSFDVDRRPAYVLGKDMLSSRLKIQRSSLLINKLNVRQQRIWLVETPSENAICSSEFMPFVSEMVNLEFLREFFLSNETTKKLEELSTGTSNSQNRVSPKDIINFKLAIPTLPEQEAIGTFFSTLDRHITLHQRKLEKLKNLKKALLNELFV